MQVPSQTKSSYRFILYGRAKSGKTCYLAALAMDRQSHPLGLTCDWLNTATHCPPPEGNENGWDFTDPVVARYKGKEWLDQAIDALEQQNPPPANQNEAAPFRYQFEFRGKDNFPGSNDLNRVYTVELIDYSGELIDPNISEQDLAKNVRQHMLEADGILVLAEAPRSQEDWGVQYAELRKLRSAFQLVRRTGVPVALVINKWDRLNGEYTLASFLGQRAGADGVEPAHVSLEQALRAAVGDANFRAFSASALGPCERREIIINPATGATATVEAPKHVHPLRSQGLEDPFVWLARRHDELQVEAISTAAAGLKHWTAWQVVMGAHLRLQQSIRRALGFVMDVPAWKSQLQEAALRVQFTQTSQVGVLLALSAVIVLGIGNYVTAVRDGSQYQSLAAAVRASSTNRPATGKALDAHVARLKEGDKWLAEFTLPSMFRVGSRLMQTVRRDDVAAVRAELQSELRYAEYLQVEIKHLEELDARADAAVEDRHVATVEQELAAARKRWQAPVPAILLSLESQVNGSCHDARLAIQKQIGTRREQQLGELLTRANAAKTANELTAVEGEFNESRKAWNVTPDQKALFAKASDVRQALLAARGRIDVAEQKDAESREVAALDSLIKRTAECDSSSQVDKIVEELEQRIAGRSAAQKTSAVTSKERELREAILLARIGIDYDAARADFDVAKMATGLSRAIDHPSAQVQKGILGRLEEFRKEAPRWLETRVLALANPRQQKWKDAETLLDSTCGSQEVKKILGEQEAVTLRSNSDRWIWTPQDRYLYGLVKADPGSESACHRYLTESRRRLMEAHVTKTLDYIRNRSKRESYLLIVDKISFSPAKEPSNFAFSYETEYFTVNVTADQTAVLTTSEDSITFKKDVTPVARSGYLPKTTRDGEFEIKVSVESRTSTYSDLGTTVRTSVPVSDLADGYVVEVAKDKSYPTIKVHLKLDGLATPPVLPDYRL